MMNVVQKKNALNSASDIIESTGILTLSEETYKQYYKDVIAGGYSFYGLSPEYYNEGYLKSIQKVFYDKYPDK